MSDAARARLSLVQSKSLSEILGLLFLWKIACHQA
jgi:hypothetical protein